MRLLSMRSLRESWSYRGATGTRSQPICAAGQDRERLVSKVTDPAFMILLAITVQAPATLATGVKPLKQLLQQHDRAHV